MRLADDLTCKELVELVTDYIDGALGEQDQERFEEHLVICRGCDIHLSQMRETLGVVGRLTEDDVDPGSAGTLLDVFRTWKAIR